MAKFKVTLPPPLRVDSGALYTDPKVLTRLMNIFTFTDRYGEKYCLAKKTRAGIYVPRESIKQDYLKRPGVDKRSKGVPIHTVSNFLARNPEQERVVEECVDFLENGLSLIAQAPTGFGKTVVAMEIVHRLGVKAAVVVPKEDIKLQWKKAAAIVGIESKDIGYIQGDRCDVAGKKFIICMLQSVCKMERYPPWVYKDIGFVMFDEVHRMAAEKFNQAVWSFPAKLRLGLSATVKRKDGKDAAFLWNIGPIRVQTDMMVLKPKVLVAHFRHRGLGIVKMMPGKTAVGNRIVSGSTVRNTAISEWVASAYRHDRNILVVADTLKHLEVLHDSIVNRRVPLGQMAYYIGGMTEKQREHAKVKKVILATYKMVAEATDIPWLDTIILATPRSDVRQVVGRILREHDEKQPPVVFDIVDGPHKVYTRYYKTRKLWYKSIGAEVKNLRG